MSDYLTDIGSRYVTKNSAADTIIKTTNSKAGTGSLDFQDFLKLMVQQFQNQTPDNTASTADMMNQLVQMSVMQAVTNITDATTMLYSSSLVGKEVTIGQFNAKESKFDEIVGIVEGTGMYNGQPVIFVNGETYSISDIMAVGKLPPVKETEKDPDKKPEDTTNGTEGGGNDGGSGDSGSGDSAGGGPPAVG